MLLSLQGQTPPAILALADGTVYLGNSIGAAGSTVGEVVFNTSMTGYQEILTDPSYCQQIVTLTYPHIGNYGTNPEDVESGAVHAAGLVIKDLPLVASNFRSTQTLSAYLQSAGTVAIANIDTRQLTRQLREHGAQNGCIWALAPGEAVTQDLIAKAVAAAKAAPSMAGLDLAKVVTSPR
ncbi:MAG: carbamoyl-phosphate synthase domain-containing protein, partial [Rhodoferax sp.]